MQDLTVRFTCMVKELHRHQAFIHFTGSEAHLSHIKGMAIHEITIMPLCPHQCMVLTIMPLCPHQCMVHQLILLVINVE